MDNFDAAADVADAAPPTVTTEELPVTAQRPRPDSRTGKHLGWVLLAALVFAVSIAISLAVQLDSSASPPSPEPPACGGLYTECCDDWDDNWGPCGNECDERDDTPRRDSDRGLFDAEEDFVGRRDRSSC